MLYFNRMPNLVVMLTSDEPEPDSSPDSCPPIDDEPTPASTAPWNGPVPILDAFG